MGWVQQVDADPVTNSTVSVAELLAGMGFDDVAAEAGTPPLDGATAGAAVVLAEIEQIKRSYAAVAEQLGTMSLRITTSMGLQVRVETVA